MEEQIHFDLTTPEGREDINETIDNEYDSLLIQENEPVNSWHERIKRKFGSRWGMAVSRIKDLFRTRNPGSSLPEYLELQNLDDFPMGPRAKMQKEIKDTIKKRFPDVNFYLLDVRTGDKGQIQVKYHNKQKWYNLYQRKDPTKLNNQLSDEIKTALVEPDLEFQRQSVENRAYENQEELNQTEAEREEIQGQLETAPPEEAARLRQQLSEKDAEIARLKTTIDGALAERLRSLRSS